MYPGIHAHQAPDRPAVVMADSGRTLTYRELERESARLARYLHERGLRRGDAIVSVGPNDPQCFITYWAALRSGLYVTALNHHLLPAEALAVLENCQPAAVVTSSECAGLIEKVLPGVDSVRVALAYDGPVAGCLRYEETLAEVSPAPLPDQPAGQDMLYSSGTTGGTPKGIRPPLPARQVDDPGDPMVTAFGPRYGFDEETVYLSPAPLYHGGPLRMAVVVQRLGGTVVVLERFDAEAALRAIDEHRCTHSQWVPTMFVRMLRLPQEVRDRYDTSSMRCAIHASAPCPIDVKRRMIAWWGPVLEEFYASQEAAGITLISSEEWLERPGSVGRAALGEVRICGPTGDVLPAGEVGAVYFARDELPFVYHRNPDATEEARHPEHRSWTTPGDLGYVDEDGFLYLTDRAKFMIISGGVNVFPQEVENELALHAGVHDVAVIGVEDEDLGEKIVAMVQPAPGHQPGPALIDDILEHLRGRLARYKVPREVLFVEELPRTPTGKLAKGGLMERYRSLLAASVD